MELMRWISMTEPVSNNDFARLETKLDRMAETVEKLVLIEERQSADRLKIQENSKKIDDVEDDFEVQVKILEEDVRRLERKVDRWLNMILGGAFVFMVAFEMIKLIWVK